jgi:hypothetical protein
MAQLDRGWRRNSMNPVSAMPMHIPQTTNWKISIERKLPKRRSLPYVQKSDDRDEQGHEDARGDVSIPIAHFPGSRNERHVTCPG